MKQSPSREADNKSANQEIPSLFLESEDLLSDSQELATVHYPEPT
jgi:hypothetical protein